VAEEVGGKAEEEEEGQGGQVKMMASQNGKREHQIRDLGKVLDFGTWGAVGDLVKLVSLG
jgi:hypothetical protein